MEYFFRRTKAARCSLYLKCTPLHSNRAIYITERRMLPIYNPFRIADIHRTNRPIAGQVKPYSGNRSSSAKQRSDIGARPAIWQRNTRLIDSIRGTTIIIRLPCARIGSHSTLFRIRKWSRRYSQAEERAQQRCSCVTRGRKRRWKSEVRKRKAAETYVAGI